VHPIDTAAVKPDQPDHARTVRGKCQSVALRNALVDSGDTRRRLNRAYEGCSRRIACATKAKVKNGPEIGMADPIGPEGIDRKIDDGLRDGACHFVNVEGRADGECEIIRCNCTARRGCARLPKRSIEKIGNLPELANAESQASVCIHRHTIRSV